jgi:hypothetical protein
VPFSPECMRNTCIFSLNETHQKGIKIHHMHSMFMIISHYYSNLIRRLDQVKLTAADHQIARDAKRRVGSDDLHPST